MLILLMILVAAPCLKAADEVPRSQGPQEISYYRQEPTRNPLKKAGRHLTRMTENHPKVCAALISLVVTYVGAGYKDGIVNEVKVLWPDTSANEKLIRAKDGVANGKMLEPLILKAEASPILFKLLSEGKFTPNSSMPEEAWNFISDSGRKRFSARDLSKLESVFRLHSNYSFAWQPFCAIAFEAREHPEYLQQLLEHFILDHPRALSVMNGAVWVDNGGTVDQILALFIKATDQKNGSYLFSPRTYDELVATMLAQLHGKQDALSNSDADFNWTTNRIIAGPLLLSLGVKLSAEDRRLVAENIFGSTHHAFYYMYWPVVVENKSWLQSELVERWRDQGMERRLRAIDWTLDLPWSEVLVDGQTIALTQAIGNTLKGAPSELLRSYLSHHDLIKKLNDYIQHTHLSPGPIADRLLDEYSNQVRASVQSYIDVPNRSFASGYELFLATANSRRSLFDLIEKEIDDGFIKDKRDRFEFTAIGRLGTFSAMIWGINSEIDHTGKTAYPDFDVQDYKKDLQSFILRLQDKFQKHGYAKDQSPNVDTIFGDLDSWSK